MILVFGSINADLVTQVQRHPAPGETVAGSDYLVLPGGKGANQALAARRSGAGVNMVGAVGGDGFAEAALANLRGDGIGLSNVKTTDGTSGVALIAVSQAGENTIVVMAGANQHVNCKQLTAEDLNKASILITQNELDHGQTKLAHKMARNAGCKVVHNPAPAVPLSLEELEQIDVLVVNESEAMLIAGSLNIHKPVPVDAAREIQKLTGRYVIVTLGAAGALGIGPEGEKTASPPSVDVIDTTGAGDSFVGAFAAAMDAGDDFGIALKKGVVAGSLACRNMGAQSSTPTLREIEQHLN